MTKCFRKIQLSHFLSILLFFLILSIYSCEQDSNNSRTLFVKIHDDSLAIPSENHDSTRISKRISWINKLIESDEDIYASKNRDLWQQPQTIINYLGNLKGKTLADIGAGPNGYFTFIIATRTNVKKVIAIDIDEKALKYIDDYKQKLSDNQKEKIETRLVSPTNPQLKEGEVDFILVSNTLTYIDDRLDYLKKLRKGLSKNGQILIIDSKMKKLPKIFPSRKYRMPLYQMEEIIEEAGFTHILSDDLALNYQYIVLAKK